MKNEFGKRLKKYRQQKGYSLRDVARLIGISHSILCRLENGVGAPWKVLSHWVGICSILEIPSRENPYLFDLGMTEWRLKNAKKKSRTNG